MAPSPQPAAPADPSQPNPEFLEQFRSFLPSREEQPRIVLRFAASDNLLISGMLAGGQELAGKPAVVDVPKGKGHFLLFANNPMWRQETQGSWMLLFNAALNYDHLQAGRPKGPARPVGDAAADDDDQDVQH